MEEFLAQPVETAEKRKLLAYAAKMKEFEEAMVRVRDARRRLNSSTFNWDF